MMGFMRVFGRLRAWTTGHWLRGVIVATSLLLLIGLTIGGWAYLASAALQAGQVSVESALAEFDKGNYEEARNAVSHMLTGGLPRSEYGGPLYVLGALKIRDAEDQAVPERRRVEYMIASRYLTEASAHGMPADREAKGRFLLGQSLIESGQFESGVQVLNELAASSAPGDAALVLETQRLLAETCLLMPHPQIEEGLRHNDAVLADKDLATDERIAALLQRAECLSRLDRFDEARQAIATVPPGPSSSAVSLMTGKVLLDEVESALQKLPTSERKSGLSAMADTINSAIDALQKASTLDEQKSHIAQQACYQLTRGLALKGDTEKALKQCARTRQLFGESYEGLAASLVEASVMRQKGDVDAALVAHRRVLEGFAAIPVYRSHVLSIERIREQTMAGFNDFLERQRYGEAIALLDYFTPLFTRTEQLELRGNALEQWGNLLVSQTPDDEGSNASRDAGLEHLRAAGVAFEQLAEARFASKLYTSDLWRATEDFFRGQSFTRTIESLHKYLQYEPELRNAQALLRMGQAHLALGHIPQSISILEECIEFHPLDSSTFQARIDCAKAYWYQGNTERAEELLRDNIAGSSLKPLSPEWKDSLFELGMLLHEKEKFDDAIGTLEEAVERYPEDSQRLVAQYVIGESYRRWARELLSAAQKIRTSGEHDKTVQLARQRLSTALSHFEEVQRTITLRTHDIHSDPLMGTMLRNCYMLEGTVLFDLGRYKEAIEAYSNVSSLYPDEPFVLETFVQISNCWRRLDRHDNARGAVKQAQIVLDRLPAESDFASTTVLNREEWRMLLANMSKW
jgi:tetratricopeptide (TPR) repeat protein